MKAYITSYLYDGPHRHYRRSTKRFDRQYTHYDWRYKIVHNGLTLYRRQGFCTYAGAIASLQHNWPKVTYAITGQVYLL
jgi:hypothetical protein